MSTKIINVFDLGPGDGGKGGIVHKLANHHSAHTIIKAGGAQGSHGVTTDSGKQFAFSQWGCGTFEYVPTYLSNCFVASPEGLLNEAAALERIGILNPFDLMTCDRGVICATPYHGFISRFKELMRGDNPRGTIGTGVGEAYRDSSVGVATILANDLIDKDAIWHRMKFIKIRAKDILNELHGKISRLDLEYMNEDANLLYSNDFFEHCVDRFIECGKLLKVVDGDYLCDTILRKNGVAIIENSHGILTDALCGFSPHVSAIRTLPCHNERILFQGHCTGPIERVGVHRAYTIRHGAGPIPTAGLGTQMELLPGSCKDENRWQGKIRTGPLDFNLLKYALQYSGKVDYLAITWFDQIIKNGKWEYCTEYDEKVDAILAKEIFDIWKPIISSVDVPNDINDVFNLCNKLTYDELNVPVGLVSFGPKDNDKVLNEELVK